MTAHPKGGLPSMAEFQARAREEFQFLSREFGFREEPASAGENRPDYAVSFASPTTRIVVQGINYGMNARVAIGQAGTARDFENYDLGDLITVRHVVVPPPGRRGDQLQQLRLYADVLKAAGADILRGDHSIFPLLATQVEKRRQQFSHDQQRDA